eukprot:scaffold8241_cov296-Pinguiococcus_pyrenoidosus.AAC.1
MSRAPHSQHGRISFTLAIFSVSRLVLQQQQSQRKHAGLVTATVGVKVQWKAKATERREQTAAADGAAYRAAADIPFRLAGAAGGVYHRLRGLVQLVVGVDEQVENGPLRKGPLFEELKLPEDLIVALHHAGVGAVDSLGSGARHGLSCCPSE